MAATLVAAAAAFAAFADDSAWVYDTSKRVEPQVCRVASSSRALDGQSLAADREERQRNLLAATAFPQRFEVDYVRVWAPESDARASETNLVSRSSPGNPK